MRTRIRIRRYFYVTLDRIKSDSSCASAYFYAYDIVNIGKFDILYASRAAARRSLLLTEFYSS